MQSAKNYSDLLVFYLYFTRFARDNGISPERFSQNARRHSLRPNPFDRYTSRLTAATTAGAEHKTTIFDFATSARQKTNVIIASAVVQYEYRPRRYISVTYIFKIKSSPFPSNPLCHYFGKY